MTEILTDYDPAEDLDTPEAISVFVSEALKTDDAAYIAHALGVVACERHGRNCAAGGAFTGAAVSNAVQRGQSDPQDDACGDEGAGDFVDG